MFIENDNRKNIRPLSGSHSAVFKYFSINMKSRRDLKCMDFIHLCMKTLHRNQKYFMYYIFFQIHQT
jgi:hypothetical protein